jgi:hypothetical protein
VAFTTIMNRMVCVSCQNKVDPASTLMSNKAG